jgi:hypothetical protein
VILLDHNIPKDQVKQLARWRIHTRQIGFQVGRPEWDDQQEILRFLHKAKQATFFTRDLGFFRIRLCHRNYCLVVIEAHVLDTADLIRRFLRHPDCKTRRQRCGRVFEISPTKIRWWQLGKSRRSELEW